MGSKEKQEEEKKKGKGKRCQKSIRTPCSLNILQGNHEQFVRCHNLPSEKKEKTEKPKKKIKETKQIKA